MTDPTDLGQPKGARFHTCQFIHGEPKDRDFCGEPVVDGKPYCEAHCKVCYEPKSKSDKPFKLE